MAMLASITHLFFAISLFSHGPQFSMPGSQLALQKQQVMPNHHVAQTHNVTATRAISATKQISTEAKTSSLYRRVAARSLGEGPSALAEIACTIKNRLRVSRASLTIVLRAYHAHDRIPKPEHIEVVRKVFEGELPCPATWWYALSPQDTRRFRPHAQPVLVIKRDPSDQIWIFDH